MTNMNDGSTDSPSSTYTAMDQARNALTTWHDLGEGTPITDAGYMALDRLLMDHNAFVQRVADFSNDAHLVRLAIRLGAKL